MSKKDGKFIPVSPEDMELMKCVLANEKLREELAAAKHVIALLETCVDCDAALHGPEVDLESGAPHCFDCDPTDEARARWLWEIRAARAKLNHGDA